MPTKLVTSSNNKTSVSLYWDCQNVHVNPYLAQYFLIFGSQQGRLICQKAYANWRHENLSYEQRLHELGYDCIDVPTDAKQSVDRKLIANCNSEIAHNLSGDILILISGDGDFAKLVKQWKAKGKKVIVFANSEESASQNLVQLADQHYFVDRQLPELIEETQTSTTISYSEAVECLKEAIQTALNQGKPAIMSRASNLMYKNNRFPKSQKVSCILTDSGSKFSRFSQFVNAVAKEGKIGIRTQGNLSELFLK